MIRKLLLTLGSLFLLYRSVELIRSIYFSDALYFGVSENIIIALLVNLFITGIFAFAGFAFPTSRLFPDRFYRNINPPIVLQWYRFLGVKHFKKALMLTYWGKDKNRKKYFNGSRSGLQNFIFQANQSEFGHLMAFSAIFLVTLLLLYKSLFIAAFITTVINIIGNLYPVILQRYHRIRTDRILLKLRTRPA